MKNLTKYSLKNDLLVHKSNKVCGYVNCNISYRNIEEFLKPLIVMNFSYTNWRGVQSIRKVIPIKIWYGKTKWHPVNQWFIKAYDVEKKENRDFSVRDIKFL